MTHQHPERPIHDLLQVSRRNLVSEQGLRLAQHVVGLLADGEPEREALRSQGGQPGRRPNWLLGSVDGGKRNSSKAGSMRVIAFPTGLTRSFR